MALSIRRISYFKTDVHDRPGEAHTLLAALTGEGVNLLVFSAIPLGGNRTELTLFPEDEDLLAAAAQRAGARLTGPESAFLIQGDDRLGALADIHSCLFDAKVNVFASHGVTDGRGGFGYVVYVRPHDFERAAAALGV